MLRNISIIKEIKLIAALIIESRAKIFLTQKNILFFIEKKMFLNLALDKYIHICVDFITIFIIWRVIIISI